MSFEFKDLCPYCKSRNIDFVDEQTDDEGTTSIKYKCLDCGQDFIVWNDMAVTTRNNIPIEDDEDVDEEFFNFKKDYYDN